MSEYLIIIEETETGYSAYSPDIEGCAAVGDTKKECEKNMKEALKFHIDLMLEKGYEIQLPQKRTIEFVKLDFKSIPKTSVLFTA